MIPKSACPLWLADIPSDLCRKARPSAVSYTTPVDTICETEASRVEAIFAFYESRTKKPHYRGCPFIHASLQEAEPRGAIYDIVQRYKRGLRDHIRNSLEGTRSRRAELADQIVLLLDGAVTESYLRGVSSPMTAARNAATVLLC